MRNYYSAPSPAPSPTIAAVTLPTCITIVFPAPSSSSIERRQAAYSSFERRRGAPTAADGPLTFALSCRSSSPQALASVVSPRLMPRLTRPFSLRIS